MIRLQAGEMQWLPKRSDAAQHSRTGRDSRIRALHTSIDVDVYLEGHYGILTPILKYESISGITIIMLKSGGNTT